MENKNSAILGKVSKYSNITTATSSELALLEAPKESLEILEAINLTHHVHKVKKNFNEQNKVARLKEMFGKNVYLGSDIKKLCIMYDLKCPRAQYYKGEVGLELAQIINKFIIDNQYEVEENQRTQEVNNDNVRVYKTVNVKKDKINTTSSNFFILAPSESFVEGKAKSMNATLFYRESSDTDVLSDTDHLVELHSWGNNYSDLRMINSMILLKNHADYDRYGRQDRSETEEFTLAGAFYVAFGLMLLSSIIGIIFNSMGFIYFNLFVSIAFLLNLLLVTNEKPNNLKHFKSWNQNKY